MKPADETPPPILHAAGLSGGASRESADGSGAAQWDLRTFAGQPIVLAFLNDRDGDDRPGRRDVGQTSPADLAQGRAELRGLGAVLLLISRRGLWSFSPDDELEMFAPPGSLADAELAALRAWLGPPQTTDALFVLDASLHVGFARSLPAPSATFAAIVDALAVAGRSLTAARGTAFALTRRQFVVSTLIAAFAAMLADSCASAPSGQPQPPQSTSDELVMSLNINGSKRTVKADPRLTLLDALRERLGLTGTKKGCDQGQCGACTVLVGGRRVNACLTLAVMVQDVPITTIEGVSPDGALTPMQAAFVSEDGFQCGYCTAGQIMSALGLRAEHRARHKDGAPISADDIREQMSGNICRCGAYPNIVAAVSRAWKET